MSLTIVSSADWHVNATKVGTYDAEAGMHANWIEAIARVRDVVDLCNERDADLLLNAGDTYDTGRPESHAVHLVNAELARLKRTKVIVTNGNHDQTSVISGHYTPIDAYMSDQPWCYRASGVPELVDYEGLTIASVPWYRVAGAKTLEMTSNALRDDIKRLGDEAAKRGGPSLLFGHVMLSEIEFNPHLQGSEKNMSTSVLRATLSARELEKGPWSTARLGHVHKRQGVTDNVGYIGSPYKVDFGEANEDKGAEVITIHEDGTYEVEFVPFDVRQLVRIDISTSTKMLKSVRDDLRKRDVLRLLLGFEQDPSPAVQKTVDDLRGRGVVVEMRRLPQDFVNVERESISLSLSPQEAMKLYAEQEFGDDEEKMEAVLKGFGEIVGKGN